MASENDNQAEAVLLGQALRQLREGAGLSQEEAAEKIGLTGQGWGKYERGIAPTIFQPSQQKRLAEAVGATVFDLLRERNHLAEPGDDRSDLREATRAFVPRPSRDAHLVIRDRVQAGAWLRADMAMQAPDELPTFPAVPDPRFPHASQWLSEITGDSVDRLKIFDGDLAWFVSTDEIAGYSARTGDIVQVERRRFQGRERELTIKQVEATADRILLWPRSHQSRVAGAAATA